MANMAGHILQELGGGVLNGGILGGIGAALLDKGDKPDKKPDGTPQYKAGTPFVPKTGPAILHKGEAVIKKDDAAKMRSAQKNVFDDLGDQLGSGHPEKPKKEIDHIRTRKAKSGGYIHEHHYTHPEHHPKEEHISATQDAMVDHMMQHMGEPNPGEAQADAGQGGMEAAPSPDPAAVAAPA